MLTRHGAFTSSPSAASSESWDVGSFRSVSTHLDRSATTPLDPRVAEVVLRCMTEEFGNSGSRTHELGLRAQQAVERIRRSDP